MTKKEKNKFSLTIGALVYGMLNCGLIAGIMVGIELVSFESSTLLMIFSIVFILNGILFFVMARISVCNKEHFQEMWIEKSSMQ